MDARPLDEWHELERQIVSHRNQMRPKWWIAEKLNLDIRYVQDVVRRVGLAWPDKMDRDTYLWVEQALSDGASLTEVWRTTGSDYRDVKRLFPNYQVRPPGGPKGVRTVRRLQKTIDELNQLEEGGW